MNTKFSFCLILTAAFSVCNLPVQSAPLKISHPPIGSAKEKPLAISGAAIAVGNAGATEAVSYTENVASGVLTTVDQDGTEYVIDTKNHIAYIRKAGVIVDSMKSDGTTAICLDDVLAESGSDLETLRSKW